MGSSNNSTKSFEYVQRAVRRRRFMGEAGDGTARTNCRYCRVALGVVADHDPVVTPLPERAAPVSNPPADLFREVGAQVLHEAGELLLVFNDTQ